MTDQEFRTMRAGALPLSFAMKASLGLVPTLRGIPIPIAERRDGTDLSKWNGLMNHQASLDHFIKFSYFRASLGIGTPDSQYTNNRIGALYPWGSYHGLLNAPGGVQAAFFCAQMGGNPGCMIPVVDVEWPMKASIIKSFCLELYHQTHPATYGMVYTSASKWAEVIGDADKLWIANHCPLWVAHWGTTRPIMPTFFGSYDVHQHSAEGNRLGAMYGAPPEGDNDMDLNWCAQAFIDQYSPPTTLEQRVSELEERVTALEGA